MSGLHKRKSLKNLLEEARDRMTQAPEHIRAARVLAEMQEDLHAHREGQAARQALSPLPVPEASAALPPALREPFPAPALPPAPPSPPEAGDKEKKDAPAPPPVAAALSPAGDGAESAQEAPPSPKAPCRDAALKKSGEDRNGCPGGTTGGPSRKKAPALETAPPPAHRRRSARKRVKEILPRRSPIVGERQKQLYGWLVEQGGAVRTTLSLLTGFLNIEDRALRRILTTWEREGVIEKRSGQFGVEIKLLIDEGPPPRSATPPKERSPFPLADVCPGLCAAGFTEKHLKRIMTALTTQNIDTGHVWTGLRYAEWELANGKMTDKAGEQVASPVDWVFKSLITDGTYRIPKGYLTPAEIQRQQAEEEMARERKALEELERLREEKAALEFRKQVEALLADVLADPESETAQEIMRPLPDFIRRLGSENALFQRSCRVQVEWHLQGLTGKREKCPG